MFSCNDTLWAVHSCFSPSLTWFELVYSQSNCNWMSRQRRVDSQFPISGPAFSWSLNNLHFICFFLSLHSPPSFSLSHPHLSLLLLPLTHPSYSWLWERHGKVGSCCQLSEVHSSWREPQWPGQCWKGHLPSHLLRDMLGNGLLETFSRLNKPFIIRFPVCQYPSIKTGSFIILWLFPSNLTKAFLATVSLPYKGFPSNSEPTLQRLSNSEPTLQRLS